MSFIDSRAKRCVEKLVHQSSTVKVRTKTEREAAQNRGQFRLPNRPEIGELWRSGAEKKVCGSAVGRCLSVHTVTLFPAPVHQNAEWQRNSDIYWCVGSPEVS